MYDNLEFEFRNQRVQDFLLSVSFSQDVLTGSYWDYEYELVYWLCFSNKASFDQTSSIIETKEVLFYSPCYLIYSAIEDLFINHGQVDQLDSILVVSHLRAKKEFQQETKDLEEKLNTKLEIWLDEASMQSELRVKSFAQELRKRFTRFQVYSQAKDLEEIALNEANNFQMLEQFEASSEQISKEIQNSRVSSMQLDHDVVNLSLRSLDEINNDSKSTVLRTGLQVLDTNILIGSGEIHGILARTGEGKSALSTQISLTFASQNTEQDILFISTELTEEMMLDRVWQATTGINTRQLRAGFNSIELDDFEQKSRIDAGRAKDILEHKSEKLPKNFYLYSNGIDTVDNITSLVLSHEKRYKRKVRAICIDHFHGLDFGDLKQTYNKQAQDIVKLQKFLNANKISCILTLQPKKQEFGAKRALTLDDIEGSGRIKQTCNTVLAIQKYGFENYEKGSCKELELQILKNRNGIRNRTFKLKFYGAQFKFKSLDLV